MTKLRSTMRSPFCALQQQQLLDVTSRGNAQSLTMWQTKLRSTMRSPFCALRQQQLLDVTSRRPRASRGNAQSFDGATGLSSTRLCRAAEE